MIIVNVKVPALEKVYNFSLEEKALVGEIIEEIVELVTQRDQLTFGGDIQDMVLYLREDGIHLDRDSTLDKYGIQGGSELILV